MNHICPNKNVSRAKMAFFKWEDNILYGILALKSFIYIYIYIIIIIIIIIYIVFGHQEDYYYFWEEPRRLSWFLKVI